MKRLSWTRSIIYFVLFIITLAVLIPVLNLVAMSLSDPSRVKELTGLGVIPKGFSFINYEIILSNPLILKSIANSVFITIVGTFINLFLTSLMAYVLARTNFVGKKVVLLFLIAIMVFEPSMITEYLLMKDLNLLNTYASLILYKAINVYYLFILMRFFQEIPESLIEAARIDGAGHFRIFTSIVLPLSKPALATLTLFYGVYHWNEYFRATIYITDPNKWPLQVVLRQFVVKQDNTTMLSGMDMSAEMLASLDFGSLQASTIIIAIIPLLLLYPLILKYFTKGTMDGGVKD
ncbi:carbohydrate ABC transporter permease [Robertmurraya andreesenii]|uniref:Aldouronate transport system permease protein n=1 Tax=Anoxybacillus andreesenii TaxID=1325932 RepID=A0ABT9V200_9BACL|nr:carbohydrate ABC transporter permease [Robertmurraya andreesenii]MDQ0154890.1 putative aldouronate transport system permease protein [Robertmurraya andreesenii]